MSESVRSVDVIVRLYFKGHDLSRKTMQEALDKMEYSFSFDNNYLRIIDAEIVDTFAQDSK